MNRSSIEQVFPYASLVVKTLKNYIPQDLDQLEQEDNTLKFKQYTYLLRCVSECVIPYQIEDRVCYAPGDISVMRYFLNEIPELTIPNKYQYPILKLDPSSKNIDNAFGVLINNIDILKTFHELSPLNFKEHNHLHDWKITSFGLFQVKEYIIAYTILEQLEFRITHERLINHYRLNLVPLKYMIYLGFV